MWDGLKFQEFFSFGLINLKILEEFSLNQDLYRDNSGHKNRLHLTTVSKWTGLLFLRIIGILVLMRRSRVLDLLANHGWTLQGRQASLAGELVSPLLCSSSPIYVGSVEGRRIRHRSQFTHSQWASELTLADGWNKGIRRKNEIGLFWKTSRRFCALDITGGVFDTLHLSDRVLCMLLWLLLCLCISDSVLNDTLTDCKTRCRHLLVFYIFKTMSFM